MFKSLVKCHNHNHIVYVNPRTMTQYNIVSIQATNYIFNNSFYLPIPEPSSLKIYPNVETDKTSRRSVVYNWCHSTLSTIRMEIPYMDFPNRFIKPQIHVFNEGKTTDALEFISTKGYSKLLWGCIEFKLNKGPTEILIAYSHSINKQVVIPLQKHFNYPIEPYKGNIDLEVGMVSYDGFNYDAKTEEYPENKYTNKSSLTPMNVRISILSDCDITTTRIGEYNLLTILSISKDKQSDFSSIILQDDDCEDANKILFEQFGIKTKKTSLNMVQFYGNMPNNDINYDVIMEEPANKKCVMM